MGGRENPSPTTTQLHRTDKPEFINKNPPAKLSLQVDRVYTIPMQISTRRATITTRADMINPWIIGRIPDFFIEEKEMEALLDKYFERKEGNDG